MALGDTCLLDGNRPISLLTSEPFFKMQDGMYE